MIMSDCVAFPKRVVLESSSDKGLLQTLHPKH